MWDMKSGESYFKDMGRYGGIYNDVMNYDYATWSLLFPNETHFPLYDIYLNFMLSLPTAKANTKAKSRERSEEKEK